MGLVDRALHVVGIRYTLDEGTSVTRGAATGLSDPAVVKVKPAQQAIPSYLSSVKATTALPRADRNLGNTDIARMLRGSGTTTLMADLAHSSPDLSASMFAYLRTGIPQSFNLVAKNLDGTFNPEATTLAQQLVTRFDLLSDYGLGFTGTSSMRSNSEILAKDIWLNGALCGELVLGKDRLPLRIQPLASTDMEFVPRKDGSLFPRQKRAGETIDLDIPTFFYVMLDKEVTKAYASPPMESAIKPVFFSEEFMSDLQRVIKRAVHPRLKMTIDETKFMDDMPPNIKDKGLEAVMAYRSGVLQEFVDSVAALNPEDALVMFSNIVADYLNNGNSSLADEWTTLSEFMNARMATGAKTLPSILGHSVGSTNIASTETLQFMKNAEGAITFKLNEFYSKIFTLAVRLFGQDVYVEFTYDPIDLRPKAELESFKQTKQSRVLQLLSYGFITDEEASIDLTGYLPPAGFKPLSGTQFFNPPAGAAAKDESSNNGSTLNQALNSDLPAQGKGGNAKDPANSAPKGKAVPAKDVPAPKK